MKRGICHQTKKTNNVTYLKIILSIVYDKLSSNDVFDFDNYLN